MPAGGGVHSIGVQGSRARAVLVALDPGTSPGTTTGGGRGADREGRRDRPAGRCSHGRSTPADRPSSNQYKPPFSELTGSRRSVPTDPGPSRKREGRRQGGAGAAIPSLPGLGRISHKGLAVRGVGQGKRHCDRHLSGRGPARRCSRSVPRPGCHPGLVPGSSHRRRSRPVFPERCPGQAWTPEQVRGDSLGVGHAAGFLSAGGEKSGLG